VAQLGARFHGMEEVVSSNLTRSTKQPKYLQNTTSINLSNWGLYANNGGKTQSETDSKNITPSL
jgi:hypothetical protein